MGFLPNRRHIVAGLALGALAPRSAAAQAWPSDQLRIVVPFPAGGSVDAIARLVQAGMQERLGTGFVIENRAGASGSVGATAVSTAPPDGLTWLFVFDSHAVNPALIPDLPFDSLKDLAPVSLIGTASNVLATHPDKPFKSFAEVIESAKKAPRTITYGTIGSGSLGHLAMTLMANKLGIELVHVPFKGGGPAMTAALGGHVDLIIGSAALISPHALQGTLRPLVHTGSVPMPAFPGLPALSDSSLPGFSAHAWWGVFAPAGTPEPIIERFHAALSQTLDDERVARHLRESQQITIVKGGPAALKTFFADQMKIWGDVVRENGIKPGD